MVRFGGFAFCIASSSLDFTIFFSQRNIYERNELWKTWLLGTRGYPRALPSGSGRARAWSDSKTSGSGTRKSLKNGSGGLGLGPKPDPPLLDI